MKLACSFYNIDHYCIQQPCMILIVVSNIDTLALGSEKVDVKLGELYQSHVAYNSIC